MLLKYTVCFSLLFLTFPYLYGQEEIDSVEIQTEKIQNNTSDAATIRAYWEFMLRFSSKNLSKKFSYTDKNNLIVNMYKLNYSLDTIEFQMLDYMEKDPIHACEDIKRYKKFGSFKGYIDLHKKFYAKLDCRCKEEWAKLDSNLIRLLVVMDSLDQKYRKNASDAPWIALNKDKWIEQGHYDTYNQILLEHIFVNYGYPSYRKIGYGDINETLFVIFLHCSVGFKEKYLALIKTMSECDDVPKYFYAQSLDRILMEKGKAQIYGTQLVWNKKYETLELYQVKDMTQIDKLRKELGFNSLASYLKANNAIIPTKKKN